DILGYRPEQVTQDPRLLLSLAHPDDRHLLLRALRHHESSRSGLLLRLVHANGSLVWAEVRFSFTTDSSGRVTIVDAIVRDVSERMRLHEHLIQAQKMETVAQLAGGIAHEFNNLMMAATGHATFAAEALAPSDPVRRDIDMVIEAATKAATLTRQLLAFSRRQLLRREPTDLNEQVREFRTLASHFVSATVRLETDLDEALPLVDADPGQVQEVLVTLASNASDAMPRGGTLRIGTEAAAIVGSSDGLGAEVKPGDYARLTVSDDGIGMSDEVRKHLFEPFYTTKGMAKGTGLGLASVYGIVKQHQGAITVATEDGAGTTISIYLPVDAGRAPVGQRPTQSAVA
ncbi:MAG: two-component system sensor histidine kinase NtrB, partial [Anaerolineae bacterium]